MILGFLFFFILNLFLMLSLNVFLYSTKRSMEVLELLDTASRKTMVDKNKQ